jgi:hypothetical protein
MTKTTFAICCETLLFCVGMRSTQPLQLPQLSNWRK